MGPDPRPLLDNNKKWADQKRASDPAFFDRLAEGQSPDYLWLGCADSRVPASQIVGLEPGELFTHRNVANLASSGDMNFQSVLQYAVLALKVKHIIVCGHYGCGGVLAALENQQNGGTLDAWLEPVRAISRTHKETLAAISDPKERWNRLCELNVQAQVNQLSHTPTVQTAWANQQPLTIHGWVYALADGTIRDLSISCNQTP